MCFLSNIGNQWGQTAPERWPQWFPDTPQNPWPPQQQELFDPLKLANLLNPTPAVTREEFDALKKEIEALKDLMLAAKKFDEQTGQKDCESADKVALFKKLAEIVGVDLSEVFAK